MSRILCCYPKSEAKRREDAEESEPEPKEMTVAVLKLTEGLGLTEDGIKVFEDVGWKERRAASTGQGIVRMRAGWLGGDLKEKKRSLLARLQCLICSSSSRARASPPVLLDSGYGVPDDPLTVGEEVPAA